MHPRIAFGQEPQVLLVRHESERRIVRPEAPELTHPRRVVQHVEDPRLSGFGVDAETGKTRVLDVLHDTAWVRELGGFGPNDGSFGFMPDQKHLWFLSERDAWMHLYTVDATAEKPAARQLTQGRWEIESLSMSADKKKFYITSTEVHPGERHIYAMSVDGGDRTKLTSMTGGSAGEVSPDDGTFGVVYSAAAKPHEVYLMANRP